MTSPWIEIILAGMIEGKGRGVAPNTKLEVLEDKATSIAVMRT